MWLVLLLLLFPFHALSCDLEEDILPLVYETLDSSPLGKFHALSEKFEILSDFSRRSEIQNNGYIREQISYLQEEYNALLELSHASDLDDPEIRNDILSELDGLSARTKSLETYIRQILEPTPPTRTSAAATPPSLHEITDLQAIEENTPYSIHWSQDGQNEQSLQIQFSSRTLQDIQDYARDHQTFSRAFLQALQNGIVRSKGDAGIKRLKGRFELFEIKVFGRGLERRTYGCIINGVLHLVSFAGHSNSDLITANNRCKALQ